MKKVVWIAKIFLQSLGVYMSTQSKPLKASQLFSTTNVTSNGVHRSDILNQRSGSKESEFGVHLRWISFGARVAFAGTPPFF